MTSALGTVTALAGAAEAIASALERDPEAQRIAAEASGKLKLGRLTKKERRQWYRDVESACDDLAEAESDAEQMAAVLRLLALGVTDSMIAAARAAAEVMP